MISFAHHFKLSFLTELSRTLGALISLSRAYCPSQTIHLQLFHYWLETQKTIIGVTLLHPQKPQSLFLRSQLLYVLFPIFQQQAIVKLHGVFVSH